MTNPHFHSLITTIATLVIGIKDRTHYEVATYMAISESWLVTLTFQKPDQEMSHKTLNSWHVHLLDCVNRYMFPPPKIRRSRYRPALMLGLNKAKPDHIPQN
jgi:hypothetical protein